MPTLTIEITDEQAAAIAREVVRVNANRALHGQAAITTQELALGPINAIMAREKAEDLAAIQRAFEDPAKAAAIKAAAGLV